MDRTTWATTFGKVKGFEKRIFDDFILGDALDDPKYIQSSEQTRHFLDEYFVRDQES
jgi:hypothetical protein